MARAVLNFDESMIDWQNAASHLLLNSRLAFEDQEFFKGLYKSRPNLSGHIFLATSGTTVTKGNGRKLVALSKSAILASAQAVNQFLEVSSSDVWASALPRHHVGGLGIEARAYLAGNKMVSALADGRWDPNYYLQRLTNGGVTLSALVPTQIFDLVSGSFSCPPQLRAVVVGGGVLSSDLYASARSLGWPLLPSYGMTECGSQVATASLKSLAEKDYGKKALIVLPHLQVRVDALGQLRMRGTSLLTAYGLRREEKIEFYDPKDVDGWFTSEDRGNVINSHLEVYGRGVEFVKIMGENVNLSDLEQVACRIRHELGYTMDLAIGAFPDTRLGYTLWLFVSPGLHKEGQEMMEIYNQRVSAFERVKGVRILPNQVRNEMGKILRHRLFS
jgi:O-succinylbenzoic acid--CoA ligase